MVTKDGITIKRTEGYMDGAAVSFRSGDINLVVLRKRANRRYLVSAWVEVSGGKFCYIQFWPDRDDARDILKKMKGRS